MMSTMLLLVEKMVLGKKFTNKDYIILVVLML